MEELLNPIWSFLGITDPGVVHYVLLGMAALCALGILRKVFGIFGGGAPTYHAPTFQAPSYPPSYPPQYPAPYQGPPQYSYNPPPPYVEYPDYPRMEEPSPTVEHRPTFRPLGFRLRGSGSPMGLNLEKGRELFVPRISNGRQLGMGLNWGLAKKLFLGR